MHCYLTITSFNVYDQVRFRRRGKVLGGSSSINGMEWTRATFDQYDAFERLGNEGWNSTSMFKYVLLILASYSNSIAELR